MSNLEKEKLHLVFSYGTLVDKLRKHNVKREGLLEANLELSTYGMFPALIPSKNMNTFKGFFLVLNDEELKIADEYEGHPDVYVRKQYNIETNSGTHLAWAYIIEDKKEINVSSVPSNS